MLSNLIVGIGAQKSGTTWLYEYFKRHPEVCVSPIKELHFFDSVYRKDYFAKIDKTKLDGLKAFVESVTYEELSSNEAKRERFEALSDWALMMGDHRRYEHFFKKRLGSEKYACDITPSYSMLDRRGFDAVKSAAENVKIIFILRNPVDRYWSALKMADRSGHADKDFDFESKLKSPEYILRGDYERTYRIVEEVFDAKDIFVSFYEEVTSSSEIMRLCDFLGIDRRRYQIGFVNDDKKKEVLTGERRAAAFESCRSTYQWAREKFGTIPRSWSDDVEQFG